MSNEEEIEGLPNPVDMFLNVPIFESFEFSEDDSFYEIEYFHGNIDCYCIECGRHSVFYNTKKEYRTVYSYRNYYFSHVFKCSRDTDHQLMFLFRADGNILTKIGQFPSLADLETVDIQKYRKALGQEKYKELARAVGLVSHGVGIGAYVYLRRIFETLIEKYKDESVQEGTITEENYQKSRMDEKINLLKNKLPPFLVENRSLYSILSKGVHSLSENECLEHFPVIKLGIELILDDELEKIEKEEKIKKATKEISLIQQGIKDDKP